MTDALQHLDAAMAELKRARSAVAKKRSKQVTAAEELDYLKSIAYAWFQNHRKCVMEYADDTALANADAAFKIILNSTGRYAARATYRRALADATAAVRDLRSLVATAPAVCRDSEPDDPPPFDSLAADPKMQAILARRWNECLRCLSADAHLAATVMMGGLLEALFVARVNRIQDKSPVFKANSAPRDHATGKTLQLKDWTLRAYIDVAYELGWITQSGKDIGAVLRDYRNYVHPQKEYSRGVTLGEHDSRMFWEITKSLSRQVLSSLTTL